MAYTPQLNDKQASKYLRRMVRRRVDTRKFILAAIVAITVGAILFALVWFDFTNQGFISFLYYGALHTTGWFQFYFWFLFAMTIIVLASIPAMIFSGIKNS